MPQSLLFHWLSGAFIITLSCLLLLYNPRRGKDGHPAPGGRPGVPTLPPSGPQLQDLFLAIKSTGAFHRSRLDLLLQTWISRGAGEQTYIFTDEEDAELRRRIGPQLVVTNCSAQHSHQALSCKMAAELAAFVESGKSWFCHLDDDNYLNAGALLQALAPYSSQQSVYLGKPSLNRPIKATEPMANKKTRTVYFWFATGGAGFCINRKLALRMAPWASGQHFLETSELIHLPDDCTMGYIIAKKLRVRLLRSSLFHSHLEDLREIPTSELSNQVTLSYGVFQNKQNTVDLSGPFSIEDDPSRFRSLHCLLYPETSWCPPGASSPDSDALI